MPTMRLQFVEDFSLLPHYIYFREGELIHSPALHWAMEKIVDLPFCVSCCGVLNFARWEVPLKVRSTRMHIS